MKIINIIILVIITTKCWGIEKTEAEVEFENRFNSFIEAENLSQQKLITVWNVQDTPELLLNSKIDSFKECIDYKIKEIEFTNISLKMEKRIVNYEFSENGNVYVSNLKPYKYLKIHYAQRTKQGSDGSRMVLGFHKNKLYIIGYKKKGKP
jgi:hypothetical protein